MNLFIILEKPFVKNNSRPEARREKNDKTDYIHFKKIVWKDILKKKQSSNTEEILITHDKGLIILVCRELLQNSKDKEK